MCHFPNSAEIRPFAASCSGFNGKWKIINVAGEVEELEEKWRRSLEEEFWGGADDDEEAEVEDNHCFCRLAKNVALCWRKVGEEQKAHLE